MFTSFLRIVGLTLITVACTNTNANAQWTWTTNYPEFVVYAGTNPKTYGLSLLGELQWSIPDPTRPDSPRLKEAKYKVYKESVTVPGSYPANPLWIIGGIHTNRPTSILNGMGQVVGKKCTIQDDPSDNESIVLPFPQIEGIMTGKKVKIELVCVFELLNAEGDVIATFDSVSSSIHTAP